MEITDNMSEILNLYNFFDSVIITDEKGVIKYYTNMRADVYWPDAKNITGMHILELHPELTEETSSIMRVLKTGEPIFNQLESFYSSSGQVGTNIYCTLPLMKDDKIVGAVDFARVIGEKERKNIVIKGNGDKTRYYSVNDIISNTPEMIRIKDMISQVAQTDSSVLIYGETGTGKEMIAQAIHTSSNRNNKNFVVQNCAAIPATLLEGILFGTVKGSFTGAEDHAGLFEIANGGTLFLDEINSMDLPMQAKLLRAIEEKKIWRVGGSKPVNIDVKIISALNQDPIECVNNNLLRQDLFYRLNVVQFYLPPLRERRKDIELLTNHFIFKYNLKMNKQIHGIDNEVRKLFNEYYWPGNVRELQNVIEGAFNTAGFKLIRMENMPQYLIRSYENQKDAFISERLPREGVDLKGVLAEYEKKILKMAISEASTIAEAARKLNISKQDLNYKIKKYELK
ncbi:MAG: sigma 54-interacting transcriptional regulator, partial [Anaerovoracaceae bacterium]|nr:sigma 54-interacting transcriptional regulator [Bacillota bacterium]MEE0517218.1 sigma 54-interacting transcriptional regulator [Anaerovoracaceae bacterium]